MASKVNRELAAVSSAMLPQKLHAFFSNAACKVFSDFSDPYSPPEESAVQQHLVEPLQWLLCGGDPGVVLATLDEHKAPSNFCGKVFKSGEPAYFCKDCQTDPTCCLCMECFEHSGHKDHRYRLFASGGGGCCDCGDPEAWTSCVHCDLHKPTEQNEDEVDPVEVLSSDLADRARVFFSTLLWYCLDILCWQETKTLPAELMKGRSAESLQEESFLTFLYNDEVHSYDEVIYTLTHNIKLTHTEAVAMATYVDRKGRAVIKSGSEEDCLRCKELINTGLVSTEPLKVVVYHKAVAAHHSTAILCLSLLKELSEKSAAFRRLISIALVERFPRALGCCVLDKFFLNDSNMWIAARINWQRLVMSSIYMDPVYKKEMAINLTRNYFELQKNFVRDSHNHDVCASNMTVQMFTVPSLNRMLVAEHSLLEKILGTLLELLEPCVDPTSQTYKLRSSNYKHSRLAYIMYDLRYVLRSKPEVWTDQIRTKVLAGFSLLLDLLGKLQNADPVKRQRGFHVEREEPWEHTFNFSIVLQPAVLLFADWCTSDRSLLCGAVKAAVQKYESVSQRSKLPFKNHSVDPKLVGKKHIELILFDILKDHVSIHQPLPRLIASLLVGATMQKLTLPHLLQISPTDTRTPLFLMEHCSQVIVMAVQVLAGMWKRNGYSVVNQVINYQFHYSKEVMFDKDILMLQAMAAILEPEVFMYALIYKFRLEKWLTCPESDPVKRGEGTEDALRFFISEAEDFLFLLIIVFSERYTQGVGEGVVATDTLRREIIHRLYISPLSHSELLKQFRLNENENEIDRLLKEVATLRRAGIGGKSVFELKQSCEEEYSPFFYHYNRTDQSKAEDVHRKKIRAAGVENQVAPAPPRHPPPFCEPFWGVMRLTCCPVLHRVMHCVFKQASSPESKFWSDKLLHETLHLCALMLSEETPTDPRSLCNAAIGKFGDNGFLDYLESLLTNRRAEEHHTLLTWTVQYLRRCRDNGPGSPKVEDFPAPLKENREKEPPPSQDAATSKREMAKMRRDRLMAQMSAMQRKFLEDHKKEIEGVDSSGVEEVDAGQVDKTQLPSGEMGVFSLLGHAPSPMEITCILCQEETKDFASQERTFVQAVHVQQSCVLRKCPPSNTSTADLDFLSARADIPRGSYTSGCGHHMHAECWKSFLDSKQQEHGRRHFFPLPGQSVQWHTGEFLCPLCQCYSNTILPLLPHLRCHKEARPPSCDISIKEWRELVSMAVELGKTAVDEGGEVMDQGSSVDPTFLDRLKDLFPNYRKPTCYYSQSDSSGDRKMNVAIGLFSQAVYMRAYSAHPNETSEKVCVAEWNNCAYTIASLEVNARSQDKFLLGSLSSRQMDALRSLVRLGSEGKVRPRVRILAKYAQDLINSFLLDSLPFTELPNILEVDTFTMLVNLHFTLVSLFASLSDATGSLDNNLVIPSLLGLTDQYLMKIVTAAHVLQYLLTTPPAMDVDTPSSSDQAGSSATELAAGKALQQLWAQFRQVAGLPADTPPSPHGLYTGLQEHLYPLLHCATLFFHCLSGIDFPHSSGSLTTRFSGMCQYLALPPAMHTLFDSSPSASKHCSIANLTQQWCRHPRIADLVNSSTPPLVLVSPRQLIDLPNDFSDLVKKASAFQCPNSIADSEYGEEGQAAMLCLVCGEMLCTNSYCCQKAVEGMGEGVNATRIGGFTQHTQSCGVGMGMALWILEAHVVLLDTTDLANVKGCTVTPPYLDEYGEPDPGLRRGNPLKLNEESYQELKQLWFQHRIPERICKEMEGNRGLMRVNWSKM